MRKVVGLISVILGVVCLLGSLSLVIYNHFEDKNAAEVSRAMLEDLKTAIHENKVSLDNHQSEMPTIMVDGYECIGYLSIPSLNLELPVLTDWSYEKLKKAPCLYYGSYFEKNFVIAAHNYKSHFGRLSELHKGDKVIFTNVVGKAYKYEVILLETLQSKATEEMLTSGFDLSLYTCTPGGASRVTVRCNAAN